MFVSIPVKCIRVQPLMETLALDLRNPTFHWIDDKHCHISVDGVSGRQFVNAFKNTHTQSQQIMRLPTYSHITPLNIETKSTRVLNLSYIFN